MPGRSTPVGSPGLAGGNDWHGSSIVGTTSQTTGLVAPKPPPDDSGVRDSDNAAVNKTIVFEMSSNATIPQKHG